ncbi:kynureninase [Haloprofundus halobius]|uniref:kynureninase n=1 Tax=Haloprofundus halobius TaxID=2876194 RepID=UPI001CCF3915|nr:kynureninase [Haloprofundus halobius]
MSDFPSRETARELDRDDPLSEFADRFDVPDGQYMDGNSLGPISEDAERTLDRVVDEWRELGIRGWTDADEPWFTYAERLGSMTAPLVGAEEDEVVVANSTTVNIHTLVGTFLDVIDSPTVVVDDLDFPTDHYAIRAQLRQRGHDPDEHLVAVESRDSRTIDEDDVVAAMAAHDPGIVFLPSVLYRSGQLLDIERLTEEAHERGILAGFDLAHSVGAIDHDLSGVGVDFAVWCNYKYLSAGPGAIAGLYVNREHFGTTPALAGWWGHDKATQFDMELTFTPADDAGAWQIGTVPMLSAAPLEGSLRMFEEAGIETVREKSVSLTDYLVELVDTLSESDYDCEVGTPRDPDRRGGHVAVEHPEAYRVSLALKERDIVVDYRPPNVVRICPAPLYNSHEDVWDVVDELRRILSDGAYGQFDRQDGGVT